MTCKNLEDEIRVPRMKSYLVKIPKETSSRVCGPAEYGHSPERVSAMRSMTVATAQ